MRVSPLREWIKWFALVILMTGALIVAIGVASRASGAERKNGHGIWRWDGDRAHVEVQGTILTMSERETQRWLASGATGSEYIPGGLWYVPFTVQGDVCVLWFMVVCGSDTMVAILSGPTGSPRGVVCGERDRFVSGLRVIPRGGRSLRDATAVVAVTRNRGALKLRWIGGPR